MKNSYFKECQVITTNGNVYVIDYQTIPVEGDYCLDREDSSIYILGENEMGELKIIGSNDEKLNLPWVNNITRSRIQVEYLDDKPKLLLLGNQKYLHIK